MPFSRLSRFGIVNSLSGRGGGRPHGRSTRCSPARRRRSSPRPSAHGMPVARILLTHAHQDHIGSLDALHAALPEAEVIIGARERRLLAKDKSLDPGEPVDKLRGGYTGAKIEPDRTIAPGDRGRLARGTRRPRPYAGPARLPRSARRDAVLRRRLLDLGRGRDHLEDELALPAAGDGHLAPPYRARDRAGVASARPEAPRPRPRQGGRGPGRGDGRRDRQGVLSANEAPTFISTTSCVVEVKLGAGFRARRGRFAARPWVSGARWWPPRGRGGAPRRG